MLDVLSGAGEEVLTVTRDHIGLRPGAVWVDVDEVMRARRLDSKSVGLFKSDLLEDLDGIDAGFDAWLNAERERVRERVRVLAEALLREQTEPDDVLEVAQQLLDIDRTHEGAWRSIMRAHASRGERGLAIHAYDRCRAQLADMLDASPSMETQRLLNEIRGPSSSRQPLRPPRPPEQAAGLDEAERMNPASLGDAAALIDERPRVNLFLPNDRTDALAEEHRALTRGGAKVGVLPLQLVGTSGHEVHLATGLAEEITTALARFRWMFLVSSNTLARFSDETRDEAAIRRAFGIDFLLDGTIQRDRDRLRITIRLMDLRAGSQVVWARRFDRDSHDLLSLQDDIAAEVVAQIDPEILLIEANRAAAKPPQDPTAYDLLLRGIKAINRMDCGPFMEAGVFLTKAIQLEPDYAAAHAWYAYWHVFLYGQGWAKNETATLAQAGELAERAVSLDPTDARALTIGGHVRAFLHRRLREAYALHDRALTINPNLAMAWVLSGATCAYLGDLEEAERRLIRYKVLSPLDPHAFIFDTAIVNVKLLQGDYEGAAAVGRHVTELNPAFSSACKSYLSALGHLGRTEEIAAARRRLMTIEPRFTIDRFLSTTPFERAVDQERFARGLRLAGVPERES